MVLFVHKDFHLIHSPEELCPRGNLSPYKLVFFLPVWSTDGLLASIALIPLIDWLKKKTALPRDPVSS